MMLTDTMAEHIDFLSEVKAGKATWIAYRGDIDVSLVEHTPEQILLTGKRFLTILTQLNCAWFLLISSCADPESARRSRVMATVLPFYVWSCS